MKALEHRMPPPVVAVCVAVAMWLAAFLAPATGLGPMLRYDLAAGFALPAAVFAGLGFRAFGRARTTIDPVHIDRASSLVTTGIYRLTRNPMYVGLVLSLCGWAAWLAVPWAAAGPPVFVAFVTRYQILPEERILLDRFGQRYVDYCRRVRRWI